jgi:hypothetical protein
MKAFRKANGVNRTELNKLMKFSNKSGWQRIEDGYESNFTLSTLIRISTVMEITLEELLSE